MKLFTKILLLVLVCVPAAFAQDTDTYNRGSAGVFLDFLRLKHADLNQYGFGGRVGFNVHRNVQLEAEGAYDFRQSRSETVTSGVTTSTYRADLRTTSFMFGPKFQTSGPVKVFGTVKGGILNFSVSTAAAPLGFTNTLHNIGDGDTNGVLYPAGGIEAYAGWFGIRAEIGDMIYFDRGANHNLRFTIGPQFRF
ncbi:MAG TPA: outer membrane beta-barrel protein [Terriglobales bacterium]|nr:outer membrane beta-barrel protein [Terriglobales bacterium]